MPKISYLFISFFISVSSQASIYCEGKSAGVFVTGGEFKPLPEVKIELFRIDGTSVFLTHMKNNFYSLEMFMPLSDQRLYAEGAMPLGLAAWTRDELIEISCR